MAVYRMVFTVELDESYDNEWSSVVEYIDTIRDAMVDGAQPWAAVEIDYDATAITA